jgi:hypothetical protein
MCMFIKILLFCVLERIKIDTQTLEKINNYFNHKVLNVFSTVINNLKSDL